MVIPVWSRDSNAADYAHYLKIFFNNTAHLITAQNGCLSVISGSGIEAGY